MPKAVWRGLGIAIAMATVLATPVLSYQLFKTFLSSDANVKIGVVTAIVSVIAFIYNNSRQQSREISSRHFSKKRMVYQEFFDLLFEFLYAEKTGNSPDSSVERLGSIVKSIMVWGSADTINAYNSFLQFSSTRQIIPGDEFDIEIFSYMERLLRSMREDLGHSDRKLHKYSLSKLFIVGDEHHKFR